MFEPYVQNVWGSKRSHWREGNCLGRQPCTRTTFCANVDCLSWVILQSQALVHCTRKSGLYKAFHRPPHRLRALVRIVTVEDPRRMPNTPSPQGMTGAHCNSQLRLQPMHDTSSKTSDSLNSMLICIPTIYRKWFTDHPNRAVDQRLVHLSSNHPNHLWHLLVSCCLKHSHSHMSQNCHAPVLHLKWYVHLASSMDKSLFNSIYAKTLLEKASKAQDWLRYFGRDSNPLFQHHWPSSWSRKPGFH